MAWLFVISTGEMYDPNGDLAGSGYSGDPEHKNNPSDQQLKNQGPIPVGMWRMDGFLPITEKHGPDVITLKPAPSTETYGRGGFMCHGDSILHPGCASEGCIIQSRAVRLRMWQSGDHDLEVIAA